ncbi:MAG: M3 family metallopeptidase [Fidelibacterota bacterium]|jgi:peptidyl-dipeptidase Dcp
MLTKYFTGILSCILIIGGCTVPATKPSANLKSQAKAIDNPFYKESSLYFKYPQFDKIKNEHYTPAFQKGMAEHMEEVESIANSNEAPTLDNTIIALEISGALLNRVATVFFSLISANTNDEMEDIQSEMAPKLSTHNDQILLNGKLFERVSIVYESRNDLNLDAESVRLIEKYYIDFVRSGAKLSSKEKERLKSINSEMAVLQTTFSQNVLKEVNALAVIVDTKEELNGLSDAAIEAAANEAISRKLEGKYVVTLRNTSGQPPMSSLTNRALRERIHKTSLSRGSRGGEFDNRKTLAKIIKLRSQRAQLMGYANHAAYSLENQTAQTTTAVNKRLLGLAPAAVANATREAADLQKMINAEGGNFELASWDWDFYTEKVRADRYNFDAAQLKPYFEMNNVLQNGVFYAANQLFGITFKERFDLPVYQVDVRVFEVFNEDGSVLALFIFDGYARTSKRGGAWMNAYVAQSRLKGTQPVIANHLNVTKPPKGEPTFLTFDEVITTFHEFGHALHGMFSDVNYPYFAGTSVPRDFVEYPSQVNEMWAIWPEVLKNYAVNHETGKAMPKELLDKVLATQKFNQGFTTIEYLAASVLDQSLHQLTPEQVPESEDLLTFEADALKTGGVAVDAIPPRYRSTYFSHIIGGYSAGYYSYIWSEVLDADTVEWFKENGGLNRKNGEHFRRMLLSRGGSEEAMVIFKNFRGAEPNIQPLLNRRGLN